MYDGEQCWAVAAEERRGPRRSSEVSRRPRKVLETAAGMSMSQWPYGRGPPTCPPRWGDWGDGHASWAEIDKIRARAAASQQETMTPGPAGPRQGSPCRPWRPTETRAGTALAKLHDAKLAAMPFRHQVPELVPGAGLLGAGRCSLAGPTATW